MKDSNSDAYLININLSQSLRCHIAVLVELLCLCGQAFEFSVFEVNIRFVGGMLACYALTGDKVCIVFIL